MILTLKFSNSYTVVSIISLIASLNLNILIVGAANNNPNGNSSHYLLLFGNSSLEFDGKFFHIKPFFDWQDGVLKQLDGFINATIELVCLKGVWIFYSGSYLDGENEMINSQERNCYKLNMSKKLLSVRYIPLDYPIDHDRNNYKKKTKTNSGYSGKIKSSKTLPEKNSSGSSGSGSGPGRIFIYRRSLIQSYLGGQSMLTYAHIWDQDLEYLRGPEDNYMLSMYLETLYIYLGDFSQIVITGSASDSWTLYDKPNYGNPKNNSYENGNNSPNNITSVCIKHGRNMAQKKTGSESKKFTISYSPSLFRFNVRSIRKGCQSKNVTFLNSQVRDISESYSVNRGNACQRTKVKINDLVGSLQSDDSRSKLSEKTRIEIKNHIMLLNELVHFIKMIFNRVCGSKLIPNYYFSSSIEQFVKKVEKFYISNENNTGIGNLTRIPLAFYNLSKSNLQDCFNIIKLPIPLFSLNSNSTTTSENGNTKTADNGDNDKDDNNYEDELNSFVDQHGNRILVEKTDFMETVELVNELDPVLDTIWLALSISFGTCAEISPERFSVFHGQFVTYFLNPLTSSWIKKPECGVKNNDGTSSETIILNNMKLCNAAVYMRNRHRIRKPSRPINFQWNGKWIKNKVLSPQIIERNILLPR